ncbi:MAG: hypothetical protein GTO40_23570 [Deltaproteobacteria bacterium]|nr:hypothetical protein [Deltaproteobacteria bacterium]
MKRGIVIVCAVLILMVIVALWFRQAPNPPSSTDPQTPTLPQQILQQYLQAVYARDYHSAYPRISEEDRRVKSRQDFLRENPSFTGQGLGLARTLASKMEISNVRKVSHGTKTTLTFHLRLPDASDPTLQKLLLEFDLDRLSALTAEESRVIEQEIHRLASKGTLPMLEGEEKWEMVKEGDNWRVYLNWAGAPRVAFLAKVMDGLPWEFEPMQDVVSAKPGETLQAMYRAKNLSDRPITAKARHIDEPKALAAKHLEIIQCFCFIQQTLAPGEEKELPLVFRIDWNVPTDLNELRVTYEFYPIDKFPEN